MENNLHGFRLSPQQRAVWSNELLGSTLWSQLAIRIEGRLNKPLLVAALTSLLERHEILRTSFICPAGLTTPLQVIAQHPDLDFDEIKLEGRVISAELVNDLFKHERSNKPDFARASLVRFRLVCFGDLEWLLLASVPSLCADTVTLDNLFVELCDLYQGESRDVPEIVQYVDFSEWQLQTPGPSSRATANTPERLPFEAKRDPANSTYEGYRFEIDPRLATGGADVFRNGLQVLLCRLSGESQSSIGVILDGRDHGDLKNTLGPCWRLQESTCDISGDRAWHELAPKIDDVETAFAAVCFEYNECPAPRLVDDTKFSIFLRYSHGIKFKLKLSCARYGGRATASLYYDNALFDAASVEQLAAQLQSLLLQATAQNDVSLAQLSFLSAPERALLQQWNETQADYPGDQCIHHLFEAQVARTPDATAVIFHEQRLTYGELNERANQLAHRLIEQGIGPETLVAVCLDKSLEMVATLLGVLKARAAYVVLDPEQPQSRLQYLVEVTEPQIVISQRSFAESVEQFEKETIWLDADPALGNSSSENPDLDCDPDLLAYVVFTSGSSGRPKGVAAHHRGVVNYLSFVTRTFGLSAADRILQLPFLTFDAAVRDLFGPLSCGAEVVIADRAAAKDPAALMRLIDDHRITGLLSVVPSLLRMLALQITEAGRVLGSVRIVLSSGEPLRRSDGLAVRRAFGDDAILVNQYGPTESTMTASFCRFDAARQQQEIVSIGRPISNYAFRLLDHAHNLAPIGSIGEVYISSVGLARGYFKEPDSTAEKFVPDTFSLSPGARLYATGDLARYNIDGNLEFLSRADDQFKIRGVRVEAAEVEAALLEHSAVREVVVTARPDAANEPALVAYVLNPEAGPSGKEFYALPNGMMVAHLNQHETDFFYKQIFVDGTEFKHGIELSDGDVVFDVGANIGLFTLLLHQRNLKVRTYAFEPIPEIAVVLRTNVELYGLDAHVVHSGLSDARREVPFAFYPNSTCQSGYYPNEAQERHMLSSIIAKEAGNFHAADLNELLAKRLDAREVLCPVTTISDFMREQGVERIDLLKIDVEKSELDVLNGIADADWSRIRQIVIETHDLDGRLDQLVELLQSRGYSVLKEQDPSLQDTCLYNVYAIRAAATGARKESAGNGKPVSVSTLSRHTTAEQLREFLQSRLPDYLIPSSIVFVDAFPRTSNGKIDRKALLSIAPAERDVDQAYVAPRTVTEEVLASIWSNVLGLPKVGVHQNFFKLGGHSLLAMQVISSLRGTFRVELPLRCIFDAPTVAQLAEVVDKARPAGHGGSLRPVEPRPRDRHLPLSFAQERLWFLHQLDPELYAYNIPAAVRIRGPLDVGALQESLNEVVKRNEILRTTFSAVAGRPSLVILPVASMVIPVIDLSDRSRDEQEAEVLRSIGADAKSPFDLTRWPLLRAELVRLAEEEYVFLFTLSHMISDEWSMGLLIDQLTEFYDSLATGRALNDDKFAVQYADYAWWQRDLLKGEVLESQLAYWKERLSAHPPLLELPADRGRPAIRSYRGSSRRTKISPAVLASLRQLCIAHGCTLHMALLAAFQTLLARYSGQKDILVGSPIANRRRPELEKLIGFFVNIVVMRADFSADPTFESLLQQVKEAALHAYANQDVPFETIVAELNEERTLSHTPVFQVLFVLQNTRKHALTATGLTLELLELESPAAKFDLVLSITELDDGLSVAMEYNTDLFDATTIDRMLVHFNTLLESACGNPASRTSALPILSPEELHQVLVEWNDTREGYPLDVCIHHLFEACVAQTPDVAAATYGPRSLTYAELNERANRLARYLRTLGVGPEVRVALCLERSLELLVGIVGVLKAGGAYVPLDPAYPAERLTFLIDDAKAPVLLTHRHLYDEFSHAAKHVVCLDSDWPTIAKGSGANLGKTSSGDNLAYVIYTSGSTGKPKGVMVTHRGICNTSEVMVRIYNLPPGTRMLQYASQGFDMAVFDIIPAIISSATVCFAPQEPVVGHDLVQLLAAERIEVLTLPPTILATLPVAELPDLCFIRVAGEAISAELATLWSPSRKFFNAYGPAEGSVWVSGAFMDGRSRPTIGRPIANTKIYLLDEHLRPVPVNVPGELCIGGISVSRGYLNRPGTTAERFVPDPFSDEPGMRLYRTGDLCRYLIDGDIEFLGRTDDQVKIHGFRIELGEVETVIKKYPGVKECVAMLRSDAAGVERLVAYLISEGTKPANNELRDFLRERLPLTMIPSAFVHVDEFPVTPNGKLDRRALPVPEVFSGGLDNEFVAPSDDVQRTLAKIWAEVIGVERVGIYDNFFDLGGHSLLATQLVSRVRGEFKVHLPLRVLFETPTVAGMQISLAEMQDDAPVLIADTIGKVRVEQTLARLEEMSDEEVQALFDEIAFESDVTGG